MSVTKLTPAQLNAIVIIERTCSSFSLVGCAFIVITFVSSKAFHKPINRLVFLASVGNILTNSATLISRSALNDINGALCQFQGFMIQMFMCADAYWTFAMACNVYLTFFQKYDAEQLRTMEKWYFLVCYGLPFIPAVVYIFLTTPETHTRLYGDATLWCWISKDFDVMRIATFYAPVWVAIILTFFIYLRAGKEIYKKRQQLMSFSNQRSNHIMPLKDPFQATKTTEIRVTSEAIEDAEQPLDLSRLGHRPTASDKPQYAVNISCYQAGDIVTPIASPNPESKSSLPKLPPSEQIHFSRPYITKEANIAAWSYTKVAILFFTAMLVTWIPSTANRVYSVVNPGYISPGLQFASAFVLPLQGFWNAVIYTTTSWHACRKFFSGSLRSPKGSSAVSLGPIGFSKHGRPDIRLASRDIGNDTESTTELASRPHSKGSGSD